MTQTDRERALEEALQEAHTALCFLASGMDNPGDSAFARQAADKAERALVAPSPAPAPERCRWCGVTHDRCVVDVEAQECVNYANAHDPAPASHDDVAREVAELACERGAEAWCPMTEAQDRRIAELECDRDNLLDQLALRSESAMAKDNQEIMRINNELVAEREALRERAELLERYTQSVAMWMDRENVTDQERLSYIKGHPVTRAAAAQARAK